MTFWLEHTIFTIWFPTSVNYKSSFHSLLVELIFGGSTVSTSIYSSVLLPTSSTFHRSRAHRGKIGFVYIWTHRAGRRPSDWLWVGQDKSSVVSTISHSTFLSRTKRFGGIRLIPETLRSLEALQGETFATAQRKAHAFKITWLTYLLHERTRLKK